jgi:hypothetical protein
MTVANLVRAFYVATVVRRMDNSRQRRGLPRMDRYGRRCLLALTLIAFTLTACTAALVAAAP